MNGVTLACKLSDLSWDAAQGGLLQAGSLAILSWRGRHDDSIEIVDAPWLKEYHRHTWQYL